MEYTLEIICDLFFAIIDNKRYLVDTGSPFTFSKNNDLFINDKKYQNSRLKLVLNDRVDKISTKINKDVSGIIGLDIIKEFGLFIDKMNLKISFVKKDIIGKMFSFEYLKKEIYEYMIISLNTYGLSLYGIENYLFDTGISDSIFDLSVCTHSQYAYRKDVYYLALDNTYCNDFVFETLNQGENKIYIEASMNYDKQVDEQFEFARVKGLLSINKMVNNYLSIDPVNKTIIID